jgi:hypothetical protein
MKAPSTNIQAPEKFQAPSFKTSGRGEALEFGFWSFSGAWMLVLGAFPLVSSSGCRLASVGFSSIKEVLPKCSTCPTSKIPLCSPKKEGEKNPKTQNPKSQTNAKPQIPIVPNAELKLGAWDLFGAWVLGFGASATNH